MRAFLIRLAALGVSGVVTLVLLEVAVSFLPYNDGMVAAPVSSDQPIYRFLPDREFQYSQGWQMLNSRVRRINNDGFVSDIDYQPDATTPLLAIIGDSYIEAVQVDWEDSVQGVLSKELAPERRVYAFGAAYAALAQYLAWAEYARDVYAPQMLVVNVVHNDFLQKLPKPGQAFDGGFQGMHYFAAAGDGELIIKRSDRPEESIFKSVLRRSALVAYAYRNLNATSLLGNVKNRIAEWFEDDSDRQYIANTVAKVDDEDLLLSEREIDLFLERLPEATGLPPSRILLTIDGMRPTLYDPAELERAADSFPARMTRFLLKRGSEMGFEVVHLQEMFLARHEATGQRFEYPFNNHWNANGHRALADAVRQSATFAGAFSQ